MNNKNDTIEVTIGNETIATNSSEELSQLYACKALSDCFTSIFKSKKG